MGLLLELGAQVTATRALENHFDGLVEDGRQGTVAALDLERGTVTVRFTVPRGSVSVQIPDLGVGYLRRPRA
jgi:hypothetical protein